MTTSSVGIRLSVEGATAAEAEVRRVQQSLGRLGDSAESVRGALGNLAGAFAGAISVRAFVEAADAVTTLQNQLRLATGSIQGASQAYGALFEIAQRSRVSFTELGGTFASITRATEALGLSQQQVLRITEAVGNAVTVSGASAQASQAALVQLSQGLASGVLRGEELNSILEQTPRLARALADGLGVPIGKLRELGQAGELTAEAVLGALQSQAGVLAREVQDSVVTVSQAFQQVKNSATAVAGEIDRVSGSSNTTAAALQAVSDSLDNISRAFKGSETAAQDFSALSDAIAVVFETVAVLGVNVAYVIKQIGTEIGGLAAQAVAIASGDFQQAREIGRLMREDGEKAARDAEALSNRILAQRKIAELVTSSLKGVDTRAEDARLLRYAQQADVALSTVTGKAGTAKKATDEFAKSVERGAQAYQGLINEQAGLSPNFYRQWEDLANAFKAGKISADELSEAQALLIQQQPISQRLAKEAADKLKDQEKAERDLAKAEFDRVRELERNAESVEQHVQRLLDEESAIKIAAEKNITLAQALEEVAIARLREKQAALMSEGGRDAEVLAIQREIDARKQLAAAIGRKEVREAAAESARDAAREWQRTADNIERSLTDALLRGFESGKDFARNLRDTVVNMFKTMVLRPIIQAVVSPVAGAITGALGLPAAANAASGASSLGSLGSLGSLASLGGTFGAGMTLTGFTGAGTGIALQGAGSMIANGSIMQGFAQGAGALAPWAIGGAAGIYGGRAISNGYSALGGSGNTAVNIGTIAGAIFGGPIGAAIGGAIGGLFNRAFGRKLVDSGIEGTFSGEGFSGNSFEFLKGGTFRSDKTNRGTIDPALDSSLDQQFAALRTVSLELGKVLGVSGDALNGFSQSIKLSFKDLTQEQIQQKLTETFNDLGENLARAVLGSAGTALINEGETASEALVRLAAGLQSVNAIFSGLGETLFESSIAGADAASQLISAFGGVDQFNAAASTYFQNFYTEQERVDAATRRLTGAFSDLGLTLPSTREEFRKLVDSQDLTTEAGRNTYAALLQLSGAFAELVPASEDAADAIDKVSKATRSAADILNERSGLEQRLLQLQGNTVELRRRERDALDETNRALFDQITALEDFQSVSNRVFSALPQFLEDFYSPEERTNIQRQQFLNSFVADASAGTFSSTQGAQTALDALIQGVTSGVGDLRGLYRGLVEAQDLNTDAGRRAVAVLLELAPAFADLVPAVTNVTATVEDSVDTILTRLRNQTRSNEDVAQSILGLEGTTAQLRAQLLEAQGDTQGFQAAIRELETAGMTPAEIAIYDLNNALRGSITAANALAAAERNRTNEANGLQRRILQLQGDTAGLRQLELDALDPANRALLQLIFSLEDAADAASIAADAEDRLRADRQRVANERGTLEERLLRLMGDTAELRRREREALDPSNRALFDRITALEDQKEAEEAATRATEELRRALEAAGDSVMSEVERLRGSIGGSAAQSAAGLQAQFAVLTAQARAGDSEALGKLPEISRAIEAAFATTATSALEITRIRGQLADSLSQTLRLLGLDGADTSTTPASITQPTPEIPNTNRLRVNSGSSSMDALNIEVRGMREENQVQARSLAQLQLRVARVLERWDVDGLPVERVEA